MQRRIASRTFAPAVFPVTAVGYRLAVRLSRSFKGSLVHTPEEVKDKGLRTLVKEAFKRRDSLVFVSAVGIAVRAIAPFLKGKEKDPAVVVLDERARYAISLLSGHLGGANLLAKKTAAVTGAEAVITTATDLAGLPCVEDIAGRFGFRIKDARRIKAVNSAILNGQKVVVIDRDPKRLKAVREAFKGFKPFRFMRGFPDRPSGNEAFVLVSGLVEALPMGVDARTVVLVPGEFVAGIGCRRGVSVKEVRVAVLKALKAAGVEPLALCGVATIDIKRDERGLTMFAREAGLKVDFYSAGELNGVRPPSGASRIVMQKTGAAGVAEPAALLSSGAKRLWLKKTVAGRVTTALSRVRSAS